MALAAINVVRGEFGLSVGKDVSIVGFDDTDLAKWPLFGLTCYTQPLEQMVDRTIQIITASLQSRKMPTAREIIKGQLVIRESARIPKDGTCIVNGVRIWARA
jgi:DNA-binding LacI/PurR family transcriptional regulator